MALRGIPPFYLYVVDHDKGEFSVEGPMTDDTPWINGVVAVQKANRQVNCCTASGSETREAAIKAWQAEYPHKLVPRGYIVSPDSN
jgi:hypothetical protein